MNETTYRGKLSVENRRAPRLEYQIDLLFAPMIRGEIPKATGGRSENLSSGGVAVPSEHEFTSDQLITVRMPLEGQGKDIRPVTFLAKVCWCRPAPEGGYQMGLQYEDIDADVLENLNAFLSSYAPK